MGLVGHLSALESSLNILVNNAGTAWGAPYEEYPQAAFDKVLGTNVSAMFCLTRDLTPLLAAAATAAQRGIIEPRLRPCRRT